VKHAGLATHYIPSSLLGELYQAMQDLGPAAGDERQLRTLLNDFQGRAPLPEGQLPSRQADIDRLFGGKSSVAEVHRACRESGGDFGKEALAAMAK